MTFCLNCAGCSVCLNWFEHLGVWEFGFRHDPDRPLESIAAFMIANNLANRTLDQRYEQVQRYVGERHAEGLVIATSKSCTSVGRAAWTACWSRLEADPSVAADSYPELARRTEGMYRDIMGLRLEVEVCEPGHVPRYQLKSTRIFDHRPKEVRRELER